MLGKLCLIAHYYRVVYLILRMPSPPEPLFPPLISETASSQDAELPDLREIIRLARQRKLDDVVTRPTELRRAKDRVREQEAAVRGEKARP
jgi:hypothetical protein